MFLADFHIHSKYSRATSRDCVPELLDLWARKKGLGLIGTGDFTHPAWRQELRDKLAPTGGGLYTLKEEFRQGTDLGEPVHFMVTGEISSIYKKNGRVRKIHNLILLPGLEEAEKLSRRLEEIGNLHSDGRPILGLDSRELLEITLETCPGAELIPAHIWTPHFSLFGAYSGFDHITECFEDLTGHIHALETGLSSNPPMNWRISALDRFVLVSNSDAHSPANLAREANLFETAMTYGAITAALADRENGGFRGTIEFFPEEGKYHFNGHRGCKVCQSPGETLAGDGRCPVCGGRITVGVLHRVEELTDRPEDYTPDRPPHFESLIPLPEVLAASTGYSPKSLRGRALYDRLLGELGPELHILRETAVGDIEQVAGPAAAEGVRRLRAGEVEVLPGYDGEYGKVRILEREEIESLSGQMQFFAGEKSSGSTAAKGNSPKKTPVKRPKQEGPAAIGKDGTAQQANALDGLNGEQRAAAFSTAAVTAVIAGPGAGKTKTLVARIAHLVQECALPPSAITAVTFTNKAAEEMRERLTNHFGSKRIVNAMHIGTFHSLCLDRLRKAGEPCAIADGVTALALLEDCARELEWKGSPREAQRQISLYKCGVEEAGKEALACGLYEFYCKRLEELGALDYDDILLRGLELAERENTAEKKGRARPLHLLVDEFQDSNPVQYRLVRAWGEGSRGLFFIGDPNQSIYGFRGSDSRCFEWLRRDYPGLEAVALTANYRSTPEIIQVALPVITRLDQDAALQAVKPGGSKVGLVHAPTPFSEALYVAKAVNRLVGGIDMLDSASHAGEGVRGFSDIAVLYRTNRQAGLLEECLAQEGIPYVASGRDDWLSHPKAVGTLAFFRLIADPGDLVSLWNCLRELAGCPAGQTGRILEWYAQSTRELEPLREKLEDSLECSEGMKRLSNLIEIFHRTSRTGKPQKLLVQWLEAWGWTSEPWAEKLVRAAVFHGSLREFLQNLALGQEGDVRRFGGKRYTGDAVSLMTLHGAKGLEFPVVFLCGAAEGTIPYQGRRGTADEAEERRLLYVGMTRAMEELTLLYAGTPSPFLGELPANLLEKETAYEQKREEYRQVSLFD